VADGGRTDEERKAARLERERRRAARGDSTTGAVEPAREPDPEPDPPNDGDPVTTEVTQTPSFDEESYGDDPDEVASGTRRVGWRERTYGARTHDAAPGRDERPRRAHSWRARILVVVALVLAAAVIWFLIELFQPFHGSGHGSVTVTIPAHSSSSQVGDILERDGVISSSFFFELRAFLSGDKGKLRAGTYHLKQDMSYAAALTALTTPPPPVKTTGVTIIPGSTRAQVSARLHQEGVRGSYLAATRHSRLLDPARYGAPQSTPTLEGFMFPDTYQLRVPVSIPALVADQLTAFKQHFATVGMGYARSKNLTLYDVLIIASIIEKEAATARDRPLVASVIYNRLHDHIPLGMDSTTRYEFNDYTTPLTQAQLSAQSPYNTRLHDGLPPTPISNPGLAAIRAAADPARTNYLYFVVKPCGNGESVFESSYAKFLQDSARYQAARAQRGGRSPANC
jgi:peptidoglycan lytic transglycosylase G